MMIGFGKLLAGIAVCSSLFMVSCKKKDETPSSAPKKVKAKNSAAARNKLTSAEVKSLARQRFEAGKRLIPPFDKKAALKDVVYEMYSIDLQKIFPKKEYDLTSLKDEATVAEILGDRAAAAIAHDFPDSRLVSMKEESLKRYPYHKIGDVITAEVRRPDGSSFTRKGRLTAVSQKSITVGGYRVLHQDLVSPQKWSFDKDKASRKQSSYIFNLYTRPKGEAKQKKKAELEESVYKEFGCTKKNDKWVSIKHLWTTEIKPALELREQEHFKDEASKLKHKIANDLRKEGLL